MTQEKLDLSSVPIAAAGDPITSHQAAAEITRSGLRIKQAEQCLAAVRAFPGKTSAELAWAVRMDRHAVARRLPELEKIGMVVKGEAKECFMTGRQAVTWKAR